MTETNGPTIPDAATSLEGIRYRLTLLAWCAAGILVASCVTAYYVHQWAGDAHKATQALEQSS